ncbi:FUSC family protein [Pseudomonas batumici]|uniref:Membrane fusion component of tripartite multidrug resistance system n=1 Tax=Pseudomonas batumici TaxID=226910 RepID=A0A0C2EXN0_9PSED|nr:FUSC family protein [Pseudomonas batumici]KIH83543.1 Membrane fusion component of tripartite multidrug resistance system [Pseudomonas batumici]
MKDATQGQSPLEILKEELSSRPGRMNALVRHLVSCTIVILLSMTLQVPLLSISLVLVFFVTQSSLALTRMLGMLFIVSTTLAVGVAILLLKFTFDYPLLRIAAASLVFFVSVFFMRTCRLSPLFFVMALVTIYIQSQVDLNNNPEALTRVCLWAWVAIVYPTVVTVAVNTLLLPLPPPAETPRAPKPPLLVADAFENPAYLQFAFKTLLAALLCYLLYTAVDWPGIHTAMLTCLITAMPSLEKTLHKGLLRILGCLVGSALALLCMVWVVPQIESIVGLLLMSLPVLGLAAWVSAGSPRSSYAGIQIAFAFALALLADFAPMTNLSEIRDRLVGILLGVIVTLLIHVGLWPESEKA